MIHTKSKASLQGIYIGTRTHQRSAISSCEKQHYAKQSQTTSIALAFIFDVGSVCVSSLNKPNTVLCLVDELPRWSEHACNSESAEQPDGSHGDTGEFDVFSLASAGYKCTRDSSYSRAAVTIIPFAHTHQSRELL